MAIVDKDKFLELMKKSEDKTHIADFKETKSGWVQCTKPNGDTYGLIINSLVDDLANGKKEFVDYEDKKQILRFRYGRGEGNPFK